MPMLLKSAPMEEKPMKKNGSMERGRLARKTGSAHGNAGGTPVRHAGFTLIELLVVIDS